MQPHRLPSTSRRWALVAVLASAAVLAGCASGPRQITSSVQTYASMGGVQLPATYRLELLPSQTQQQSFGPGDAVVRAGNQLPFVSGLGFVHGRK